MEKLVGDLFIRPKFVKLSVLPAQFIHISLCQVGRIRINISGDSRVKEKAQQHKWSEYCASSWNF